MSKSTKKEQGEKLFRDGEMRKAFDAFSDSLNDIKDKRDRAVVFTNLSVIAFRLEDYEKSLKMAEKAIQENPSWKGARLRKVISLNKLERRREAALEILETLTRHKSKELDTKNMKHFLNILEKQKAHCAYCTHVEVLKTLEVYKTIKYKDNLFVVDCCGRGHFGSISEILYPLYLKSKMGGKFDGMQQALFAGNEYGDRVMKLDMKKPKMSILVMSGTYTEYYCRLQNFDSVEIIGEEEDMVMLCAKRDSRFLSLETEELPPEDGDRFSVDNSQNVKLKNLAFHTRPRTGEVTGELFVVSESTVKMEDITFTNHFGSCLCVTGKQSGVRMDRCRFLNSRSGIFVQSCLDLTLDDVTFQNIFQQPCVYAINTKMDLLNVKMLGVVNGITCTEMSSIVMDNCQIIHLRARQLVERREEARKVKKELEEAERAERRRKKKERKKKQKKKKKKPTKIVQDADLSTEEEDGEISDVDEEFSRIYSIHLAKNCDGMFSKCILSGGADNRSYYSDRKNLSSDNVLTYGIFSSGSRVRLTNCNVLNHYFGLQVRDESVIKFCECSLGNYIGIAVEDNGMGKISFEKQNVFENMSEDMMKGKRDSNPIILDPKKTPKLKIVIRPEVEEFLNLKLPTELSSRNGNHLNSILDFSPGGVERDINNSQKLKVFRQVLDSVYGTGKGKKGPSSTKEKEKNTKKKKNEKPPKIPIFCGYCGSYEDQTNNSNSLSFKRCSRCKSVLYCSRSCQLKDWKLRHKVECGRIVQSRNKVKKTAQKTK